MVVLALLVGDFLRVLVLDWDWLGLFLMAGIIAILSYPKNVLCMNRQEFLFHQLREYAESL